MTSTNDNLTPIYSCEKRDKLFHVLSNIMNNYKLLYHHEIALIGLANNSIYRLVADVFKNDKNDPELLNKYQYVTFNEMIKLAGKYDIEKLLAVTSQINCIFNNVYQKIMSSSFEDTNKQKFKEIYDSLFRMDDIIAKLNTIPKPVIYICKCKNSHLVLIVATLLSAFTYMMFA